MMQTLEKKFSAGDFLIFDEKPDHLKLLTINQTHSSHIIFDKKDISPETSADGICLPLEILNDEVLAIKTADCLPILFLSDTEVALIHAGWRGISSEIHLDPKLRAKKFTHIFIAPSISGKNFEVTDEFRHHFPNSVHFEQNSQKLTFNLQKHVIQQLRECYPLAIIETSDICTYDNDKFHSYRYNKTVKRNWNIFKKRINNYE